MRASESKAAAPWRLSLFWFGIQAVWGAVLGISLQAKCVALAGNNSLAAYGEISTSGAFAAAVAQLIVGPLSDWLRARGDRRVWFYAIGGILGAIATIALYRASSIPSLLIAFIALQTAMNIAIGPFQAILPDFVPGPRIGVASGWLAGMQSAGNAVGAVLATVIASGVLLRDVLAALLIVTCILTISHVRALSLQPLPPPTRLRPTRTLVDLFISRAFVYIGFYTLLGYFYFYVRNLLPPGFALDATTASGACVLLFTLVGAAGAALAAKPADRTDERIVVTVGGGILAIAVFALAALHAFYTIPLMIALAGIGWGIFLCADWAFACRLLPPGSLATTMAIWNIAVVGPQMLAPLIATIVITKFNALSTPDGPRIAFALAGLEILLGAAWIWRLQRTRTGK